MRKCPNCQELITVSKETKNYTCSKCNVKLALCPLKNCSHVWIPRTENPRECPKCKRYI